MSKLLGAYTYTGALDLDLFYTTVYDKIPCKYNFNVEIDKQLLDAEQITFDKVKHLFTDIIHVKQYTEEIIHDESDEYEETDESVIPVDIVEDRVTFPKSEGAAALYIAADNKVIYVAYNKCVILYDISEDFNNIKELAQNIWNCFPKAKEEDKTARVGLIKLSNGEYYTSFSDIKRTNININENYNDDFKPVYEDIINFLNQRESGLILLYGLAGSGKTTMIRHLCSNVPKDYVIVPNSVGSRLGDPDLISYITSCKDYVFILEDCEQLLVDREDNPWNNAITTILNMADGLLSDVVNIKFICTFNAKVDNIDPALLRKGRCFAKYEFKELCEEKVAKLDAKYELSLKEIKPMTLAEIYNSERTDYSEETKKTHKIGF